MTRATTWLAWGLFATATAACTSSHEAPDAAAPLDIGAQVDAALSPFGGPCAVDGDCAAGLQCLTHFYMNLPECPTDSPPVDFPEGYCSVLFRYDSGTLPVPSCPGEGSVAVVVAACAEPTTVPEIDYCAGHCDSDADCRTPAYWCETNVWHVCAPDLRAHRTP